MNYDQIITTLNKSKREFTEKPTNFLCIDASDKYLRADIKVMIFGQEKNSWYGDYINNNDTQYLLKIYNDFFNSDNCYTYAGQFWNGVGKLKLKLEEEFSKQNKSVGFLWNNIIKVGRSGKKGLPNQDILDWIEPSFLTIQEEINFYKPNIVIFFTGPNYDKFIKKAFPDVNFESFSRKTPRELVRLKSQHLPLKSIRTYHPNYLWRTGFYDYLDLINTWIKS